MFYFSCMSIGIVGSRLIVDVLNSFAGQIPDWNQLQYNMLTNITLVIAFGALDIARAIRSK